MDFEHNVLEKDIERLTKEVKEHLEKRNAEKVDQDVLKAVLGDRFYKKPTVVNYQQDGTKKIVPEKEKEIDNADNILPAYLKKESPEIKLKVEELIDVAFHHGIDKSVEEARKFGPFILDALHDALTVKLYEELKKRNLLT